MKTSFLVSGVLAAATTVFAATAPVSAYSIAQDGSVIGINSGDIGDIFQVNFDGSVEEKGVDGLSGRAQFTIQDWVLGTDYTFVSFEISLTNTSYDPITSSRISRLGFNTDPDIVTTASEVDGTYNVVDSGSLPNQVGAVEVCLYEDKGSCSGGPGGVDIGDTGKFNLTLAFGTASLTEFNLSNFHLRYQSIDGDGFNDDSGTGDGIVMASSTDAPEPLTILGTGMAVGFGGLFRRQQHKKKRQQKEPVKA